MLQFVKAGLVAGARQLFAVILITSVFFLGVGEKMAFETPLRLVGEPVFLPSASVLLAWAYLLTAIGLACTQDRMLILAAHRIRCANRLLGSGPRSMALASSSLSLRLFLPRYQCVRRPPS
jgi:hypothetical protein